MMMMMMMKMMKTNNDDDNDDDDDGNHDHNLSNWTGVGCWRLCGLNEANHLYVFWECPLLVPYWREIHTNLEAVFGVNIPFKCDTLYLGNIPFEMWNSDDRKLMLILLVASKKAITRKWLKPEPPTVDEWIDIIHDIYIMEKLCFSLRIQKEKFLWIWTRWTEYVKPIRSDFFLMVKRTWQFDVFLRIWTLFLF